jgi:uncharacterized protein YqcC (DUF446 family)
MGRSHRHGWAVCFVWWMTGNFREEWLWDVRMTWWDLGDDKGMWRSFVGMRRRGFGFWFSNRCRLLRVIRNRLKLLRNWIRVDLKLRLNWVRTAKELPKKRNLCFDERLQSILSMLEPSSHLFNSKFYPTFQKITNTFLKTWIFLPKTVKLLNSNQLLQGFMQIFNNFLQILSSESQKSFKVFSFSQTSWKVSSIFPRFFPCSLHWNSRENFGEKPRSSLQLSLSSRRFRANWMKRCFAWRLQARLLGKPRSFDSFGRWF